MSIGGGWFDGWIEDEPVWPELFNEIQRIATNEDENRQHDDRADVRDRRQAAGCEYEERGENADTDSDQNLE